MTLQRKTFRLVVGAALLVLTAGCSGINASHGVSPASFFLPGLMKAGPSPATNDVIMPEASPVKQVALAR